MLLNQHFKFEKFKTLLRRVWMEDEEWEKLSLEEILTKIPKISDLKDILEGKSVFIRSDIDVQIQAGEVSDTSRLETILPTLSYCRKRGWKSIILGHVGRDKNNTAFPIYKTISRLLGGDVEFIADWLDEKKSRILPEIFKRIENGKPGGFLIFENVRKYSIEQALWNLNQSEEEFFKISRKMYSAGQDLRKLSDVLINEAVAASNMDFSSAVLPLLMSKTALGFYITEELQNHIQEVRKSNLVISSGIKIDKLDDLENLTERRTLKMIIIAGALAMALKKAQAELEGKEFHIGLAETDRTNKAYLEKSRIEQAKRILLRCRKHRIEMILPIDFVLDNGLVSKSIPPGKAQLDIGPKSRELFSQKIKTYIRESKKSPVPYTMFLNGVFGKFEDVRFESGTKAFIPLLKEMTDAGIKTFVGGGEGRIALLKYGKLNYVTHAFTYGGTVLTALTKRHIPYLKGMYLANLF